MIKRPIYITALIVTLGFFLCANGQETPLYQTQVIAHRGYWDTEGSAQNSIASLRNAARIGCYGTEFDVHLTSDGVAIVTHDDKIGGRVICKNPYSVFEGHKLSNGETLPTLKQYLEEGSNYPDLKLILEIKSATTAKHETRSVEVIMDLVEQTGMRSQVEYIAFSYHVCKELVARDPSASVAYLNGDKTPQELSRDGISGLDYNIRLIKKSPGILTDARELGLTTNSWTVNSEDDMRFVIRHGIDYITTDKPELALSLVTEPTDR
ncbi:MAG: glycerophosphodiester phosphodiesterase [Rikenellaceae bacterium]|nr:glycerophosphodiester phosphodiesterase [Rikenellaceae bacterium]